MKKKYQHPTTEVVKYELCQPMLSASVIVPLSEEPTGTQFSPENIILFGE
jgi:hypothetical protein